MSLSASLSRLYHLDRLGLLLIRLCSLQSAIDEIEIELLELGISPLEPPFARDFALDNKLAFFVSYEVSLIDCDLEFSFYSSGGFSFCYVWTFSFKIMFSSDKVLIVGENVLDYESLNLIKDRILELMMLCFDSNFLNTALFTLILNM